jgi:HEAT repeat protein
MIQTIIPLLGDLHSGVRQAASNVIFKLVNDGSCSDCADSPFTQLSTDAVFSVIANREMGEKIVLMLDSPDEAVRIAGLTSIVTLSENGEITV